MFLFWCYNIAFSFLYLPISYLIIYAVKNISINPKYRHFSWKPTCFCIANIMAILALTLCGTTLEFFGIEISTSALILAAVASLTVAYLRDDTYLHSLALISIAGIIIAILTRQQLPSQMSQELLITALTLGCIWVLGYLQIPVLQIPGVGLILAIIAVDSGPSFAGFTVTLLLQGAICWLIMDKALSQRFLNHRARWKFLQQGISLLIVASLVYAIEFELLQASTSPTFYGLWIAIGITLGCAGYLALRAYSHPSPKQETLAIS